MDDIYTAQPLTDLIDVTTQEQEISWNKNNNQYIEFVFDNQSNEIMMIKLMNDDYTKTIKLSANSFIGFKQVGIILIKVSTMSGSGKLFYIFQGYQKGKSWGGDN